MLWINAYLHGLGETVDTLTDAVPALQYYADLWGKFMFLGATSAGEKGRAIGESFSLTGYYNYYDRTYQDYLKTTSVNCIGGTKNGDVSGFLSAVSSQYSITLQPAFKGTVDFYNSSMSGGKYWLACSASMENGNGSLNIQTIDGAVTTPVNGFNILYSQTPRFVYPDFSNWPWSSSPNDVICGGAQASNAEKKSLPIVTNSEKIRNAPYLHDNGGSFNMYYIPLEPDTQYTYDEYYDIILQFYEDNPELGLDGDDVPTFEQLSDPDHEPGDCNCNCVVHVTIEFPDGEEWNDIHTELASDLQMPTETRTTETTSAIQAQVIQASADMVSEGWSFLEYMGLSNLFVNVAVTVALWKIIKKDR